LAWNQENMSKWGHMSTRGLLFQSANTKYPTKLVSLVQNGHHHLVQVKLVLAMI